MGSGKKLLIGCVVVPAALLVAVVVAGGVALKRVSTPGPPLANEILDRQERDLVPLTETELNERIASGGRTAEQRLTLDLEIGSFRVGAAAPGEPLTVEVDGDPGIHDIQMAALPDPSEAPHLLVRHRIASRGLFGFTGSYEGGPVEVAIPADRPLDLFVRVSKGEAFLDLTGLPLRSLTIDASMGETRVRFDEPNPETMRRLVVRGSMGDLALRGLGHADAREIEFTGAMGNYQFDFTGRPRGDAVSRMKVRMGNVEVRVPDEVTYEVSRRSARFGNVGARRAGLPKVDPETGELPPTIAFDLQASFGNVEVY